MSETTGIEGKEHIVNIGQAAGASGVSAKMIRYYESVGLVTSAARSAGNYRVYGQADIHTLRFIGRARAMGFSMAQIRELLGLWQNKRRASATVKAIAEQRIQELDARIASLSGMRDTLLYLSRHCEGDDRPECPILDEISGEPPKHRAAVRATRH
ncbi:Cu(I)-responsive transcriptional regulator [Cupriavidus phytorum]